MSCPVFLIFVGIGIAMLFPTLLKDGVSDLTLLCLLIPIFFGFWSALERSINLIDALIDQKIHRNSFLTLAISSFNTQTRTISPLLRPPAISA